MEMTLTTAPLHDQVLGALSRCSHLSARRVHIETDRGHVRLEGTVGTFFQKQMAQELARRVDGVERVENQLQVNWC